MSPLLFYEWARKNLHIVMGLFLIALGFLATPDNIFPIFPFKTNNGAINYMNMRLFQVLILSMGCWFVLAFSKKEQPWKLLILCGLFFLIGHYFMYGLIDDTFISLRYAQFYAKGDGLVFNLGERVEGYTCFLWVILIGTLHYVTGTSLEILAKTMGIFFGFLTLATTWFLLGFSKPKQPSREAMILILATHLPLIFWSFSGMETSFYTFLLLLSTIFLASFWHSNTSSKAHLVLAGLFMGLAGLTRPETYLFFITTVMVLFACSKKNRWRWTLFYCMGFLPLVLAHVFWRYSYYGFWLPNTFYVKVDHSSTEGIIYGLFYFLRGFWTHIGLFALAFFAIIRNRKRWQTIEIYVAVMVLSQIFAILYTGADHFLELRYFVYLVPFLIFLAYSGLNQIPMKRSLHSLVILFLCLLTFSLSFSSKKMGYLSSTRYGPRIAQALASVGRWLHQNAKRDEILVTPVAGALPFYSELRTIDVLGLTDSWIAHQEKKREKGMKDHNKWDWDYVFSKDPDYIYMGGFICRTHEDIAKHLWLPVYSDLFRRLPIKGYGLISGKANSQSFCFLRKIG